MAQTSLVTGANRGIGLELARQLAERGDDVIATARAPESASELNGLGVRVEALDVESPKSISALARRLKGAPVDLLVHNAAVGVAGPAVEEVTAEDLESHFRVNAIGPLLLTQALLPNLRASEHPRIVASRAASARSPRTRAAAGSPTASPRRPSTSSYGRSRPSSGRRR